MIDRLGAARQSIDAFLRLRPVIGMTAPLATALLGALGVLVVVTAPPSRNYRAPERSADWLGPLRSRGLVVLFAGLIGTGAAIGNLSVLVVRYAEQHRVPWGASGLLALNAAGALCGAFGYGLMRWNRSLQRRALLLAAGLMASYALVGLRPAPPLMAVLMVVTGFFLAPMLTVSFVLAGRLAPSGTVTEAFAWLVTVFTTGTAIGSAVVGVLLDHATPAWPSSCGGLATAATVIVLLVGRRTLGAVTGWRCQAPSPSVAGRPGPASPAATAGCHPVPARIGCRPGVRTSTATGVRLVPQRVEPHADPV